MSTFNTKRIRAAERGLCPARDYGRIHLSDFRFRAIDLSLHNMMKSTNPSTRSPRFRYLAVLVAMCGITSSVLGVLINVGGLFFTPIAEELGALRGSVSITLTIANLCFAIGGLFTARLINSRTFKKYVLLATLVFAGSTALMSLAQSLPVLFILSALRGFAAGFAGTVLVALVVNNWFHARTGLIVSIAMSFAGIAGAVLSPILGSVISHAGWRVGFLVSAGLTLLFQLPAMLLPISYKPEDVGCKAFGENVEVTADAESPEDSAKAAKTSQPAKAAESLAPFPIVLLVILILFAACASYVAALPPHFPGISEDYGLAVAGSIMLSVCMVFNSVGKIVFGAMTDRIGAKKTTLIFAAAVGLGLLILLGLGLTATPSVAANPAPATPASDAAASTANVAASTTNIAVPEHAAFVRRLLLLCLASALVGMIFGVSNIACVMVTREIAGSARYDRVYPKVAMGATVSNALATSLIGFMYDASGAYILPLSLALAVLGVLVAALLGAYRYAKRIG